MIMEVLKWMKLAFLIQAWTNCCVWFDLTHRNNTAVNSKVIAVTVRPEPRVTEAQLEIELAHLANVSTSQISTRFTKTIQRG